MSSTWSEANLPSAQDVKAAEETLSALTSDGHLANTDFIEWVNARLTVDWASAPDQADNGWAR